MQIEVKDLTKKFDQTKVLDRLNFSIGKGEVVGFLGPNGAGKTTTMRILTGFLSSTSGEARIADKNVLEDPLGARKKIGYLPENNPLYNDLRVYEYLKFVAASKNISDTTREIKRVIHLCGLSGRISQTIAELSKGFRQRVGLAQALLGNPEILIMDEPTSGLDPSQRIEIRNLIKKIGEQKTILLSTHILGEVQTSCSRAIIIHKGKIVASGTTEELTRESQGKTKVRVVIAGPAEEVKRRLEILPEVSSVIAESSEHSENVFSLESSTQADVRNSIFHLCVQSGWVLLELERKTMSLEDVFMKLTR